MKPRFDEMDKVRVRYETEALDGFVMARECRNGEWTYKVSHPDPRKPGEFFDNWVPEEWLERA